MNRHSIRPFVVPRLAGLSTTDARAHGVHSNEVEINLTTNRV
jgi:hypothetical protein